MRLACLLCLAMLYCGCAPKETITSHGKSVPHWLEEAKSPDAKSRKKAVTALGHVGARNPDVIPALVEAVKDADASVRAEAVLALLNIGPSAKEAIPALREATADKDATVRSCAAKALEKIDAASSASSP
jgi:HEAT repeat protein